MTKTKPYGKSFSGILAKVIQEAITQTLIKPECYFFSGNNHEYGFYLEG